MHTNTFREFFVSELQRLYCQEQRFATVLPRMELAAGSAELRSRMQSHAQQTAIHLERLERIFVNIGEKASSRSCPRVEGLFHECEKIAQLKAAVDVRDVALLATGQHFAHDQIAGYGCARTWAHLLGQDREASLLQQTLDDKKREDGELTKLAEKINRQAAAVAL